MAPESDPIREFYTRHPYPPPVDNLDRARDEWRDPNRQRADFHLFWPERPYQSQLDILVAGCGTWQAAKYAVCRPRSRVVGIDVSPTSIEATERLARKYKLENLETRELPIEHARELGGTFDLIVCTGVLHHLADPNAGLRALRDVLRADGAMYLMVYAPYGRAGIYMIQEYCRRLGLGNSEAEILELVESLKAMSGSHPLAQLLRGSRDAQNADALADALLNPRDRAYSVPEFLEYLDRSDMELYRWYWQAPYSPHCGAIAATPHGKRMRALPEREHPAAMELWRGTMSVHSTIVQRRGARDGVAKVDFGGDRWLGYIPIRLPWTQLVEDRRPPGAAAVLLNRSHSFPDLILPIGSSEKRVFDAIDGQRSISQILSHSGEANRDRARGFFHNLWRYDQVTFSTSHAV